VFVFLLLSLSYGLVTLVVLRSIEDVASAEREDGGSTEQVQGGGGCGGGKAEEGG